LSSDDSHPRFKHSSEEAFAHILDYYGVEWQYEPRTFPLKWDASGAVTEAFAPDFYLPKEDLYVELTTLRPELSTHKNRKLKRMKALYPEVRVKLFKRPDVRGMMTKYGMDQEAAKIAGNAPQKDEP
jgi:hypothetical protein